MDEVQPKRKRRPNKKKRPEQQPGPVTVIHLHGLNIRLKDFKGPKT